MWRCFSNGCCNFFFTDVEWVGIQHRTRSSLLMGLDGTLGTWILVGFAYGVNEWRMLILAVTSPLILAVIAWWYLIFTCYSRWMLKSRIIFMATWLRPRLITCVSRQVASRICAVALGQWEGRCCPSLYHEMCQDEQQRKRNGKHHTTGAFQQRLFYLGFLQWYWNDGIVDEQLDHLLSHRRYLLGQKLTKRIARIKVTRSSIFLEPRI